MLFLLQNGPNEILNVLTASLIVFFVLGNKFCHTWYKFSCFLLTDGYPKHSYP